MRCRAELAFDVGAQRRWLVATMNSCPCMVRCARRCSQGCRARSAEENSALGSRIRARIDVGEPLLSSCSLTADAPWAEGPGVGAEFLEGAGERLDVGFGEVAGEVLFDPVPVVATGLLHRCAARVGEDDKDRAAVVLAAHTFDKARFFHAVDD